MDFPASVKVVDLEHEHPEYSLRRDIWAGLAALKAGGQAVRARAHQLLQRQPREVDDVYNYRVARLAYEPILGYAAGWYTSAVFERSPSTAFPDGGIGADFWKTFPDDVTYHGDAVSLTEYGKAALLNLIYFGADFTMLDFPEQAEEAATRADQIAAGADRAYWVHVDPASVINWQDSRDGSGLDWAIVRSDSVDSKPMAKPIMRRYWYVVDREHVAKYASEIDTNGRVSGDGMAKLEEGYPRKHRLGEAGKCPLVRCCEPEHWFGERVYDLAISHLNEGSNFGFALDRANNCTLVVTGDGSEEIIKSRGPLGAMCLPTGGNAFFLEPSGKTFDISNQRLKDLKADIYRLMGLVAMSRDTSATAAAASGVSKEQDMSPSAPIRQAFADRIASYLQNLLRITAIARREDADKVTVQAPHYEDPADANATVDQAERVQALRIPSATFEKAMSHKVVTAVLPSADEATLDTIKAEIEAAPSAEERAAQAMNNMQTRMEKAISAVPQ